jgi:hypothetical protein
MVLVIIDRVLEDPAEHLSLLRPCCPQ